MIITQDGCCNSDDQNRRNIFADIRVDLVYSCRYPHTWLVETTSRQEHGAATAGGGWNPPVEFFPAKKNESRESGEQIDERY